MPATVLDLAGAEIADCSLLGADLAGADLRAARLLRVDLRLADLRGARLEGARIEFADATGALLCDASARRVRVRHVQLLEADLRGADLRGALLRGCTLERATLDGGDLSRAHLVHSACTGASFRDARLERLDTLGSTFAGADFDGARCFAASHEIVAEILLREAAGDLQRVMECAAVTADRDRCWAEWKDYVERCPEAAAFAFRVFARHPRSGCAEALRAGGESAHIALRTRI